jgi:hypothetical protein
MPLSKHAHGNWQRLMDRCFDGRVKTLTLPRYMIIILFWKPERRIIMTDTLHLALPLLAAAQAQKHVTHNEALVLLDAIAHASVLDRHLAAPPSTPAAGDRYLVAASPVGAWAGQAGKIAHFIDSAWDFMQPQTGWTVWVVDEFQLIAFDGTAWRIAANFQNIAMLGINASADVTNKLSVASAASLFNHAGAGHQIKLNKNAAGDTASLLFQTGFSGRAELGTTGDDKLHVKVSSNGSSWFEALVMDGANGNIGVGTASPAVKLDVAGSIRCASIAKASLPSAGASGAGALLHVPDEAGGAVMAFSDGTNWRRVTDRAIVT